MEPFADLTFINFVYFMIGVGMLTKALYWASDLKEWVKHVRQV